MKKYITKILCFTIIAVFCTLSLSKNVYTTDSIVTGNKSANCELTINIKDGTDGEFAEDIDVLLTDIAAGTKYNFKLNIENYLLGFSTNSVIKANTTYTVIFTYQYSDKFIVYDLRDGTAVDRFAATESGYTCEWIIKRAGDTANLVLSENNQTIIENSDKKAEAANDIGSDNREADDIFEQFHNVVKHIDGNKAWDGFFITYKAWENKHAETYAKYCSSTMEDWLSKSLFERFILYETYVRMVEYLYLGNYDRFFRSEKDFVDNTIDNAYRNLKSVGNGTEAEAYKELMLWQYEYIIANGTAYNFLTGLNYLESTMGSIPVDPDNEREINLEQERKEIAEVFKELDIANLDETIEPRSEMEVPIEQISDGIWLPNKNKLSGSLTYIILFLLVAILIGVTLYRKSIAVKTDEDEE